MKARTRIDLYSKLREQHVRVWLDGGWGVDALIGEQTRSHADVDLLVEERNLETLVDLLRNLGYSDIPRDDTRAWNFVLGDNNGNLVDIHVIRIDANGDGIYGPPENGDACPAQALDGTGTVTGTNVMCLSPEYQLANHSGYVLRDKDHQDVANLCRKFNMETPSGLYRHDGSFS